MPLTGFFNPVHLPEIDLLPADDPRFRYFLFPLNFGIPEREALALHARLDGCWREISSQQVAELKRLVACETPPRADAGIFDKIWYCHRYLDAAAEISASGQRDPGQHYLEHGRGRGLLPCEPRWLEPVTWDGMALDNIALHRPATQSSTSPWSHFPEPERDAAGAVDGHVTGDMGFHTAMEDDPWWQVDLGRAAELVEIRLYNRVNSGGEVADRAAQVTIRLSVDGVTWTPVHRQHGRFGGKDGRPVAWRPPEPLVARHVRVQAPGRTILHLDEIEVYGLAEGRPGSGGTGRPVEPLRPPAPPAEPHHPEEAQPPAAPAVPETRPRPAPRLRRMFARLAGWRVDDPDIAAPDDGIVSFDWSMAQDEPTRIHDLIQQECHDEAEQALLRHHATAPADRRVLTQLAELSERRKDWAKALHWWSSIPIDAEDAWQTELPRARVLACQGRASEARQLLLGTLQSAGGNPVVPFYAIDVVRELDPADQDEAITLIEPLIEHVVRLRGETSETLAARAGVAELRTCWTEAFEYRRQAFLLRPRDPGLRALALRAAERIGKTQADLAVRSA